MPQFSIDGLGCPLYQALTYDGECVESDDKLSVVLDALARAFDPADAEELAIWRDGETIAAVQKADGRIIHLEPMEATPATSAKPAARRPAPR